MKQDRESNFDRQKQVIERFEQTTLASRFRIAGGVLWNLFLVACVLLAAGLAFGTSVGAGYFASLVKNEPLLSRAEMRSEIYSYDETSKLFFSGGEFIGNVQNDLVRTKAKLGDISPDVINAVLATEDEFFREHNGIVPKAIFRGVFQDVSNASNQSGGSTLTQQLIKNQILTNEVSYVRKAKEILLAMRLEHFMTKDEILEAYLNVIPYGRGATGTNIAGIETAAQMIFNRKASELSLPQAAYLAGLPQAPFKYTPYKQSGDLKSKAGLQPGIARMQTVLFRMKETGYIDDKTYEQATRYRIANDFRPKLKRPEMRYPFLVAELKNRSKAVLREQFASKDNVPTARLRSNPTLFEKYDMLADRALHNNGYLIRSTIDKQMYDAMQKTKNEFNSYGATFKRKVTDPKNGQEQWVDYPVQVGAMMIENKTGRILSFVGGRDYRLQQLNHATQAFRPIGSTMKPLLVYAPAIEYGVIGAGSPVVDLKFTDLSGTSWTETPNNYTIAEERGLIPAREALEFSSNLATIRLYDLIMARKPYKFLNAMGISRVSADESGNHALALGGMTYGATVEENTNAFSTFANGGSFIDAHMIDSIALPDSTPYYTYTARPSRVFSPQTAYMITDMMRDVYREGTASLAKERLDFASDIAAKTGTTQDHNDSWLVGYNKNVTLGAWIGYDRNETLYQYNGTYGHPSVRMNKLWSNLMNDQYKVNPQLVGTKEKFQQPPGVVKKPFCGLSGRAPSEACTRAGYLRTDLFNEKAMLPTQRDDAFASSSTYVYMNGARVEALPDTPQAFLHYSSGYGISSSFIKRMLGRFGGDPYSLSPAISNYGISRVAEVAVAKADSADPKPVRVFAASGGFGWDKSASTDVIGYRVYRRGYGLVKTIESTERNLFYPSTPGDYYVVAVDITGRESKESNPVNVLPYAPPSR